MSAIFKFIRIFLLINWSDCWNYSFFCKGVLKEIIIYICVKYEVILFAASRTIYGAILSGPVAFLGFEFFVIFSISSAFAIGMSSLAFGFSARF